MDNKDMSKEEIKEITEIPKEKKDCRDEAKDNDRDLFKARFKLYERINLSVRTLDIFIFIMFIILVIAFIYGMS